MVVHPGARRFTGAIIPFWDTGVSGWTVKHFPMVVWVVFAFLFTIGLVAIVRALNVAIAHAGPWQALFFIFTPEYGTTVESVEIVETTLPGAIFLILTIRAVVDAVAGVYFGYAFSRAVTYVCSVDVLAFDVAHLFCLI